MEPLPDELVNQIINRIIDLHQCRWNERHRSFMVENAARLAVNYSSYLRIFYWRTDGVNNLACNWRLFKYTLLRWNEYWDAAKLKRIIQKWRGLCEATFYLRFHIDMRLVDIIHTLFGWRIKHVLKSSIYSDFFDNDTDTVRRNRHRNYWDEPEDRGPFCGSPDY